RDAEVLWCGPPDEFYDPPDRALARSRLGLGESDFLAVALGILFPHRRFEDLITAVAGLPAGPPAPGRLIRSDPQDPVYADQLDALILQTRTDDRIRLERHGVSQDELRDLYVGADVTVFPNRAQAYGLAPLESLASGTPVILSTGTGVSEPL